jgi:hypothetical protein
MLLVAGALQPCLVSRVADEDAGAQGKPVFAAARPNVTGEESAAVVNDASGGKSPRYHRGGSA